MNFVHPLLAIASLAPLCWAVLAWRRTARRATLVLKALSLASIILALAQPETMLPQTQTAVLALVDTSNSVTEQALSRASGFAQRMQRARGSNWIRIVPFASQPRTLSAEETRGDLKLVHAPGKAADRTSLEEALSSAVFALPEEHIPRIALITDGNENEGSSVRAMLELQRLHIPIDTFPVGERNAADFQLTKVSLPHRAYAGEQIPIDLNVRAPTAADGRIDLSAEGKRLGGGPLHIRVGENTVRVHARLSSTGATVLSGNVEAQGLGELGFRVGLELRRAKILYLSKDPPGTDANLLEAFHQAEFDISSDSSKLAGELEGFQLLVINNLDLNSFTPQAKNKIENYVKNGGGLLLIGGERQVYKEESRMDALDRALPAQLAPPKSPEGTCVALIIDKSSSMEGRKIELARLSAIGVVDHLRPMDTIGVLIFDNSYQWAVPLRRAEDKTLIKRLISGITPDGGTQIAPALAEAYRRVLSSKAIFKHIVLLTDGISEEGDSIDLAHEAVTHGITISTVGLGQDVNRTYLEKVAVTSGGKSYFLNDPAGLEQILLKDVKDYSGSTAVERSLSPIVAHPAELLNGTSIESAPPLKGYTRFTAKPTADTVLKIDAERKDPLYVRWQYGLGRAGVFTSDAKSRWAENWIGWRGFDSFWINLTRDLLAHTDPNEASIHFNPVLNEIFVSYRPSTPVRPATPSIFVLGPNGFAKPVTMRRTEQGGFEGAVDIGATRGLFRVRPAAESVQFPELGFYRDEDEMLEHDANTPLLQRISSFTGGRYNPSPAAVFDADGRTRYMAFHFWPALLALAIVLTIAELISRKWQALAARFSR